MVNNAQKTELVASYLYHIIDRFAGIYIGLMRIQISVIGAAMVCMVRAPFANINSLIPY